MQFKARREKEQLLWRSKDRLRKINIVVTDDIALRQNVKIETSICHPLQRDRTREIKTNPRSPKKKQKEEISAERSLVRDFMMNNPSKTEQKMMQNFLMQFV